MPLYRYQALAANAKKSEGLLEADSLAAAKEALRKQQILITGISVDKNESATIRLGAVGVLGFTRDLSGLLGAGLPLYESLLAVEEKYQGTKVHGLFLRLCEGVKHGKALSTCLKEFPKSFDGVYIAMIAAGEETGNLPLVFGELSKLISRSQAIKKQVTTAMIYPSFLISFCVLVIGALFFFLIPSMEELFEGRELHSLTQTILHISHLIRDYGYHLLTVFFLTIFGAIYIARSEKGRERCKAFALKIPLVKTLMTEAVLSRFSRVLSVLLSNGVAMLEALPLARKVMNHPSFEKVIEQAEKRLIEGNPLSSELKKSSLMPKLMLRMLAIAEETGEVSPMLLNIAVIYEENLEKSLSRLMNLMQPAILLFLGIMVGVILLSVLLPLTDVSSFIQ